MRFLFRLDRIALAPALAVTTAVLLMTLTFGAVQVIGASAIAQVETEIGHSLAELAIQTIDRLDQGMYERHRELALMAERSEVGDVLVSAPEKRRVLETTQASFPHYAWIGLIDNAGTVIVSTGRLLEGVNVAQRPWFVGAYRGQHLFDVHEEVLLAKLLPSQGVEPVRFVDIAFPYKSRTGKVEGVLGTHLSWQWARDIERSVLDPVAKRRAVDTLIVNAAGAVLLGPARYRDAVPQQESIHQARLGRSGSVIERWPDGKRYLVGYHRSQGYRSVAGLGWSVLVRQELEDAYRPVRALQRTILWGGLATSLGVSLLVLALVRELTRPLRAVTRHAVTRHAAALQSDSLGRIPRIAGAFMEVRILRRALNALLRKVKSNERGLREMNASLEQRVRLRTQELDDASKEARLSERRVRAVIDTALDAFIGVNQQGVITDWNPRAEEIFGWSRAEAIGLSVTSTIIPPRFRATHAQRLERFTVSGSSAVVGKRLHLSAVRKDGEEFPVEMTIGLVNAGAEHFFGTFVQDISVRKKTEDELAEERELLDAVLDSIDVGVVVCSATGEGRLLNRAARDIHGMSSTPMGPDQWAQHYNLFDAHGEMRLERDQVPLYRAFKGEVIHNQEMTVKPPGGAPRFLFASGRALYAKNGDNIGAVIAIKDVTDLKASERRLHANERLLRTITDNLPVLIAYIDTDERYQFVNATHQSWFGLAAADIIGKTVREVLGEALYASNEAQIKHNLAGNPVRFETVFAGTEGKRIVEVVGFPDIEDGITKGSYVLTSDITAAKRYEDELRRLARVDPLTGLPNRRSYNEQIAEAARRTQRSGGAIALMFLDIDHFKQVNDTFGHAAGDLVLQEFARRIIASVRATDTVCRLAGDEFTVILERARSQDEVVLVAHKILAAFQAPFEIEGVTRQISPSIGIAFQHAGPVDTEFLSRTADAALYQAKEKGRNTFSLQEI